MDHHKKEELLSLFVISLALVACSVLVYMSRSPSITGNVVLNDSTTTVFVISLLILAGLAVVIGAIIAIHKIHKEMEGHKKVIAEEPVKNSDLTYYINKAKKQGFSNEQIVARLNKEGWNKEDIKGYL